MKIYRVIHVDDDPDICALVNLSLSAFGVFEVRSCKSGEEALQAITEFNPDLLLIDLMMPEMDGEELYRRLAIQGETQDKPTIFLTARVDKETTESLLSMGATMVLAKPFDPLELPTILLDALRPF